MYIYVHALIIDSLKDELLKLLKKYYNKLAEHSNNFLSKNFGID